MSEDGIEELILPLPFNEACSDPGVVAKVNPLGQYELVSSDRAMDLLDIGRHCLGVGSRFPHTVVSLCLPFQ